VCVSPLNSFCTLVPIFMKLGKKTAQYEALSTAYNFTDLNTHTCCHVRVTRDRVPTVEVPLFPGSRPRRLAAISHQPPTLLTAVSGFSRNGSRPSLYSLGTDRTGNVSSIIACSLVPRETCLQSCCTVTCLHSRYLAVGPHVTYHIKHTRCNERKVGGLFFPELFAFLHICGYI
jgi:hypothetical protein